MAPGRVACAMIVVCVASARGIAAPAAADVPRTPAGRALSVFLAAFNSGDRARISAYVERYQPERGAPLVERMVDIRRETGGFDVVRIEHAEPRAIDFVIREKRGPTTWLARIEVAATQPLRVVELRREEIPPGVTVAQMLALEVDAPMRARVLDGIARKLADWYVDAGVAKQMIAVLNGHRSMGDYDDISDCWKLARVLGNDLRDVSHDNHLSVECMPDTVPERDPPPLDAVRPVDDRMRDELLRHNCGFDKVERLERNIGYVKIDAFGPTSVCAPTATAAMNFVAHADALVIDLRANQGGGPSMVAWIASYLFDTRTHLNDLYERKRDRTVAFWTDPNVPGPKLGGKVPVYVLTSHRTFSAGEELAYDLKSLKRATLVGETTGGGAHPVAPFRADEHFIIGVPYARAVNPITKSNWEGKGVDPDVPASAERALDVALGLPR